MTINTTIATARTRMARTGFGNEFKKFSMEKRIAYIAR